MRYIIFLCLTTICSGVHAQAPTIIPASTTIEAFSALTAGQYRFFGSVKKDTTDVGLDKSLVCPICPSCPPPVVCPVCPPIPAQRGIVVSYCWDTVNKKTIFIYQDGSTSTL